MNVSTKIIEQHGLKPEEYINIKNHINELTFIDKNKRSIYGLYFQGGICKINKQSYEYITSI